MKTMAPSPDSDSGQYLVEFGLSFVVFMMFVFFVIDMGLLIYNHNVFYHGVFVGARKASLGASNRTIRTTVVNQVVPDYLPTLLMRAHPDTGVTIRPSREIERVEGTTVTVEMDTTFGLTLLGFYTMTLAVPISSQALIIADNDRDRDGCKDSLESGSTSCSGYRDFTATYPQDHDNDGTADEYLFGGPDADADNDGISIQDETVEIAFFENPPTGSPGYAISRGTGPAGGSFSVGGTVWETWFEGRYHAPVLWDDGTQTPPQGFARRFPKWHVENSSDTIDRRTLFSSFDSDNDGWEDKHDNAPVSPTVH